MKRKAFGILSLSALAMAAISLSSCTISDKDLFEQNKDRVFIENNLNNQGAGNNGVVKGEIRILTAFTPDFVKKGGKVTFTNYLATKNGDTFTTDMSSHTEASQYINLDGIETAADPRITVTSPFAGEGTVYITIIGTVEMGSYKEELRWNLTLEAQEIQNEILGGIFNTFRARKADEPSNIEADFKTIRDENGEAVPGVLMKTSMAGRPIIHKIITSDSKEFANPKANGAFYNILADTDEHIFDSLTEAEKTTIAKSIATDSNSTIKNYIQNVISIINDNKVNGVELSESDSQAFKNSSIKSVFDKVAKIMKSLDASITDADLKNNVVYAAIINYANTL